MTLPFFRKSNQLSPNIREFDSRRQLSRSNIIFSTSGRELLWCFWSNTLSETGLDSTAAPDLLIDPWCPTQALLLSFKVSPSPQRICSAFMCPCVWHVDNYLHVRYSLRHDKSVLKISTNSKTRNCKDTMTIFFRMFYAH